MAKTRQHIDQITEWEEKLKFSLLYKNFDAADACQRKLKELRHSMADRTETPVVSRISHMEANLLSTGFDPRSIRLRRAHKT